MNRLQTELHRLYLSPAHAETEAQAAALIGPFGTVRAMVLELTMPPSWEVLSRVWYGVQTDLELAAPAIAVSGTDGLQLWFSVAEPVKVAQAQQFLEGLRSRFLPDIAAGRLRLLPSNASAVSPELHARLAPALQDNTENWSAFVAPDLAPVFADTPWLDVPPNEEGQATLLRGLATMKQPAFEAALAELAPRLPPSPSQAPAQSQSQSQSTDERLLPVAGGNDPKQFLLRVMNDDAVPMGLRIEAAKALLQHSSDQRTQNVD